MYRYHSEKIYVGQGLIDLIYFLGPGAKRKRTIEDGGQPTKKQKTEAR